MHTWWGVTISACKVSINLPNCIMTLYQFHQIYFESYWLKRARNRYSAAKWKKSLTLHSTLDEYHSLIATNRYDRYINSFIHPSIHPLIMCTYKMADRQPATFSVAPSTKQHFGIANYRRCNFNDRQGSPPDMCPLNKCVVQCCRWPPE